MQRSRSKRSSKARGPKMPAADRIPDPRQMLETDEGIARLRQTALSMSMKTRIVGNAHAEAAWQLAECVLALTDPDPRLKVMEPSIMLNSGRYFDYTKPEDFDWNPDDIAHGLSNQCRYGGHCDPFYPIAQHLVIASYAVEPGYEFEALMHDGHESFYLDVMTPFKILMPQYRRLEDRGERAMRKHFNLPAEMSGPVKIIDRVMLATEKRDLMHPDGGNWGILEGIEPLPEKIVGWTPTQAKANWLSRFEELHAAWNHGSLESCKARFDNPTPFHPRNHVDEALGGAH